MAQLACHQHGKTRVRVARVWRDGSMHTFVEWSVDIMLESDMAHAYLGPDNTDMTPTDTQKNTVYYIAKRLPPNAAPEDCALAIAKHFVTTYPKVSRAKVDVYETPWERYEGGDGPHQHGFACVGSGKRSAYVSYASEDDLLIQAGISDWKVLKTTQSGYEGYCQDEYTKLKPTKDRIVATSVKSSWQYVGPQADYHAAFASVKAALASAFFGPSGEGVYSPSVQFTLYQMASAALEAVPSVTSIHLRMPNLHFLPCDPVNSEPFENDVYVATSEPHGDIEATIVREGSKPHVQVY